MFFTVPHSPVFTHSVLLISECICEGYTNAILGNYQNVNGLAQDIGQPLLGYSSVTNNPQINSKGLCFAHGIC